MNFFKCSRTLSHGGKLSIPSINLKGINVDINSKILIHIKENKVIMSKHTSSCINCGTTENLTMYRDIEICEECIKDKNIIKNLNNNHYTVKEVNKIRRFTLPEKIRKVLDIPDGSIVTLYNKNNSEIIMEFTKPDIDINIELSQAQ